MLKMDPAQMNEEEGSILDSVQLDLPRVSDFKVSRVTGSIGEDGKGDTRSKPKIPIYNPAENLPTGPPKIELSHRQKQDIKNAFNVFDTDSTGTMNITELHVALRALGFDPTKREIKKLASQVDKGHTGKLCFTDFLDVILYKLNEKDCKDEILKAFKLFDLESTGKITYDNLRKICTDLGEDLNDEEVLEMMTTADLDGDKMVDQEEFYRIMKKTGV